MPRHQCARDARLPGRQSRAGVEATVVRRQAEPVPGAARTVTTPELDGVLPGALVVFLALARWMLATLERRTRREGRLSVRWQ